jgi:hypothetical protein
MKQRVKSGFLLILDSSTYKYIFTSSILFEI